MHISMSNGLLYWADGGILYFWACIPEMSLIYILYKKYSKNEKLNNREMIISIILLFIVNFISECSMMVLVVILFFLVIDNLKNKKNDSKILALFIISLILICIVFFIPGNLKRIEFEKSANTDLIQLDNLSIIVYKIKQFIFD